jgi:hypothetical protein
MTDYEKNKDLQQNQILHIIKIASLFFSAVAFFQYRISSGLAAEVLPSITTEIIMSAALIFALGIYLFWNFLQSKRGNNYIFKTIAEPGIFMTISLMSVMLTGGYESNYKYLFLFVIISSSIECDMRGSTITAAVSSAVILAIDLIFAPKEGLNTYLKAILFWSARF